MIERQNTEYKLSWHDDYLKSLCGFANAQGGTLIIGLNDNGDVSGLTDSAKLSDDISNKAKDLLGIIVAVNTKEENGKEYLEIKVDACPNPISYNGQYYYRNGDTNEEFNGSVLYRFLLRKQGKRWDGVPAPKVTMADLSDQAFSCFRERAASTSRMPNDEVPVSNSMLLEKLRLVESACLKRAAILLFHADPEVFFPGAYIKIGFFNMYTDLLYHDMIRGNLFEQVDKTMDLLLTRYRLDGYPFPEEAIRAAVINAVINKDYGCGVPIQISVYADQFYVWSQGKQSNTRVVGNRESVIYNPDVANAFFLAGYVQTWGQGMKKIIEACISAGLPEPIFDYESNGLMVEFKARPMAALEEKGRK